VYVYICIGTHTCIDMCSQGPNFEPVSLSLAFPLSLSYTHTHLRVHTHTHTHAHTRTHTHTSTHTHTHTHTHKLTYIFTHINTHTPASKEALPDLATDRKTCASADEPGTCVFCFLNKKLSCEDRVTQTAYRGCVCVGIFVCVYGCVRVCV